MRLLRRQGPSSQEDTNSNNNLNSGACLSLGDKTLLLVTSQQTKEVICARHCGTAAKSTTLSQSRSPAARALLKRSRTLDSDSPNHMLSSSGPLTEMKLAPHSLAMACSVDIAAPARASEIRGEQRGGAARVRTRPGAAVPAAAARAQVRWPHTCAHASVKRASTTRPNPGWAVRSHAASGGLVRGAAPLCLCEARGRRTSVAPSSVLTPPAVWRRRAASDTAPRARQHSPRLRMFNYVHLNLNVNMFSVRSEQGSPWPAASCRSPAGRRTGCP
jgi:hypothetical protein